jgi:hypothetical protein
LKKNLPKKKKINLNKKLKNEPGHLLPAKGEW